MRQLQCRAGSAAARVAGCGMGNHDVHGPIVLYAFAHALGRAAAPTDEDLAG